jgi:hypothetical protein
LHQAEKRPFGCGICYIDCDPLILGMVTVDVEKAETENDADAQMTYMQKSFMGNSGNYLTLKV